MKLGTDGSGISVDSSDTAPDGAGFGGDTVSRLLK